MSKIRLGIIREGKMPPDKRTPLTPAQAKELQKRYNDVEVICQSSDHRCFNDQEYIENGIKVADTVEDCDILMGIKEVPVKELIPEKTYLFFSHTIKEQSHNRELLRTILKDKIRLIDYETITDENGRRIIAFGRYAGIVGAYNGIWAYGKRYNLFNLRRAYECHDLEDLKTEFCKVNLPAIKIAVTGGGRVAKGAMEVLNGMKITRVTPAEFLSTHFDMPVFCQLNSRDYNFPRNGGDFVRSQFYAHPENYEGNFLQYTRATDLLIAGAYWNPKAPVLFHREDVMKGEFRIKVIADISCDLEGSIPSTKKASTIENPIYDYNPSEDKIEPPLSDEGNLTVMAVDNLPCELPRDASADFGRNLLDEVMPHLLGPADDEMIKRATIAEGGALTEKYNFLQKYVSGDKEYLTTDQQ